MFCIEQPSLSVWRIVCIAFVCLVPRVTYPQAAKELIHVLELKQLQNFEETNRFKHDSLIEMVHQVSYNKRYAIDEEYSHNLILVIKDVEKFRLLKRIDISDSAVVSCNYKRLSVWNWGERKSIVKGFVTLISLTPRRMKLLFEIEVKDVGVGQTLIYKGERKFYRVKEFDSRERSFLFK